jgi:uncharacterized protein with FMN-binding domain
MKRYPVVIGATAAGLVGVLGFHADSGFHALKTGPSAVSGAGSPSGSKTPHQTASAPPASAPASGATPPTSSASASASATGASEQYGYGVLSVRVTMSGTRIAKVAIATLQTADTYSQQLAVQVIPILQRQVLSAQSARINGISGATYTSRAYALSVQSALDKLKK